MDNDRKPMRWYLGRLMNWLGAAVLLAEAFLYYAGSHHYGRFLNTDEFKLFAHRVLECATPDEQ